MHAEVISRPEISIVIPCYNCGRFLPRALASIRVQRFTDYEVIVVDDGSDDRETLACLKELPEDIRVIHQENQGLAAGRNTGFRAAAGTYVLPLDSDDEIAPDFLDRALATLKANPGAAFAFSHIRLAGERRGVLAKHYNFFEQLFLNQLPYCVLVRKAVWEEVGGYDESMRMGYEDWEFNIRIGARGYVGCVVAEPLFHYHVSSSGMLKSSTTHSHAQLWAYIQRRHAALYTLPALIRLWWRWRRRPSSYPLLIYFPMRALFRLLPLSAFNKLFSVLLAYSAAERRGRK